MISYLQSNDFKREFFDDMDESTWLVRNEECQHYKIKIIRKTKEFKFEKFEITISCKDCHAEQIKEFTKSEDEYFFSCKNCNKCVLIFRYVDTTVEQNDSKTKIVDPVELKKREYNKLLEEEVRGRNAQNIEKEKEKEKEKIYHTSGNEKKKEKRYHTPYQPYEKINIKLTYNNRKEESEFNKLDTIENQYYIIQSKFKFKGIKPITFQSIDLDIKKTFSELDIGNNYLLEIFDE